MAIITASPKNMGRMIELQEQSLGELTSIREIMTNGATLEVVTKQNDAQERLADATEKLIQKQELNIKAYEDVAANFKIIKTPLERMGDKIESMKETLSDPKKIGLNMLPGFLGGIKERALQKHDFKKAQRALGSEASNAELNQMFKESRAAAKDMQKAQAEMAKLMSLTGLSEDQLKGTKQGAALTGVKEDAARRLGANDLRAAAAAGEPMPSITPAEAKEQYTEEQKKMDEQNEILTEIRDSLTGKGTGGTNSGGGAEASGDGGLLSSFAGKANQMNKSFGRSSSNGMIKGAAALMIISGAVWVAADAMQKFATVEWEDVGKGVVTLAGLTVAAIALGKAAPNMIVGAVALGLVGGALWIAGESLSTFADLDWETIGKGFVAIGGIGVLGAAAGAAAPLLIAGAAGLAALGGAAWIIGEAMDAIGDGLNNMVTGMERLAALDGDRLIAVGDGIMGISGAIATFGAGAAAGGLGTLIGNLLTIGQDSPIEQLEKLAGMSQGLIRAGAGIRSIAGAMAGFSEMDPASIKVLDEVPWGDMEDFADEDGVMIMETAGAKYTVGSGEAMAEAGTFSVTPATQVQGYAGAGNDASFAVEGSDPNNPMGRDLSTDYGRRMAQYDRRKAQLRAANDPNRGMEAERASVRAAMARDANMQGGRGGAMAVNAPVTNNSTQVATYRPNIRNANPQKERAWYDIF